MRGYEEGEEGREEGEERKVREKGGRGKEENCVREAPRREEGDKESGILSTPHHLVCWINYIVKSTVTCDPLDLSDLVWKSYFSILLLDIAISTHARKICGKIRPLAKKCTNNISYFVTFF